MNENEIPAGAVEIELPKLQVEFKKLNDLYIYLENSTSSLFDPSDIQLTLIHFKGIGPYPTKIPCDTQDDFKCQEHETGIFAVFKTSDVSILLFT